MNERIRELAHEAGLYDEQTPEEVPGFTACFEKFAELIVRECLYLCESTAAGRDAEAIQEAIQQHFGVKE